MKKYEMIEIQTNIEKIYKEVFGIPDIAEDTNFFEIGGNSILAAKVVQKIKTCLGINLAIQDIFEYVTVNLLISYIAKIYNEKTKMEEEQRLPSGLSASVLCSNGMSGMFLSQRPALLVLRQMYFFLYPLRKVYLPQTFQAALCMQRLSVPQ